MKAKRDNSSHCFEHAYSHPEGEDCPFCLLDKAKAAVQRIVERERANEIVPAEVMNLRLDTPELLNAIEEGRKRADAFIEQYRRDSTPTWEQLNRPVTI